MLAYSGYAKEQKVTTTPGYTHSSTTIDIDDTNRVMLDVLREKPVAVCAFWHQTLWETFVFIENSDQQDVRHEGLRKIWLI